MVAYYELFQFSRPCGTLEPESIPAGALTHINLAFVQFGDDWKMVDEYGDIVTRVTRLKTTNAGLRVNVAIGGWNFNDPPSSTYFSTMAGSYGNRQTFIASLISYLTKYGLDGIEIGEFSTSTPILVRFIDLKSLQTGSIQQQPIVAAAMTIRTTLSYCWLK